jgi:Xaa-Pro aminopeptidase
MASASEVAASGLTPALLQKRIERLRRLMSSAGVDAVVLGQPEWIYYFAGLEPPKDSAYALAVEADQVVFAVPDADEVDVPSWFTVVQSMSERAGAERQSVAVLERFANDARSHVAADRGVPWWLLPTPGRRSSALPILHTVARHKDAWELETLRNNLEANRKAFDLVAARIASGISDIEIFQWTVEALSRAHQANVAWAGNIGLGAAAADYRARPSGISAQRGDVAFVDLYVRIDHYVGDSARSFAVERPPDWALVAYERLLQALDTVAAQLTPGAEVVQLVAACLQALDPESLGAQFPHHVGHGVGLFAREPPLLIQESTDQIAAGDVICVEPGLYFPGKGGLRVEEVFVVGEGQVERIAHVPRVLE